MANKGPLSATQKRAQKSEIVVRVYRTYVPYSRIGQKFLRLSTYRTDVF